MRDRDEANTAARLAIQYVLSTWRLDRAATARLLADMTDEQLRDVAAGADSLAGHARAHLQARGLPA